jgi:hypothetical protein
MHTLSSDPFICAEGTLSRFSFQILESWQNYKVECRVILYCCSHIEMLVNYKCSGLVLLGLY